MIIENIGDILAQLPYILEYFIPGFIFIRVFQMLSSRRASDYQLILSIAISYILKAICSIGHEYIYKDLIFSWSERVIILSILALILSLISVIFSEWKHINNLILKINHKSIHDDIWHDVIDYKNGTTLRCICNNVIYTGVLVGHEEKGNDSWFVFEDYIVKTDDITYKSEDMPYSTRLAIKIGDINRVEIYYGQKKKSKLVLLLEKNKLFKRFLKEQDS